MIESNNLIREGCYLIEYRHLDGAYKHYYQGTMRVQHNGGKPIISGDLYTTKKEEKPNYQKDIPIFPRRQYRYYLRVIDIKSLMKNEVTFVFERHRYYNKDGDHLWEKQGTFIASMEPKGEKYKGEVCPCIVNDEGKDIIKKDEKVGNLTMEYKSQSLRHAIIQIDKWKQSEYPGAYQDKTDKKRQDDGRDIVEQRWKDVFEKANWCIEIKNTNLGEQEPCDGSWSKEALHNEMVDRRKHFPNLDEGWYYHLLCVKNIKSTNRGIMYDAGKDDLDDIPREGAAISSHWVFPKEEPKWGSAQGECFQDVGKAYFRTAVHEICHAMNLYHNYNGTQLMNTTDSIADKQPEKDFVERIRLEFDDAEEKLLRHMPDIWVRPGGIPFGCYYVLTPISPG